MIEQHEREDEIDHEYTTELVCPYCGYEHSDSWEIAADDGEWECPECGQTFRYFRDIEVTYSTQKMNDEIKKDV